MVGALIRSRLQALMAMWFRGSKSQKKRSPVFKILIGLFVIYILGCFGFMFGGLFQSLLPLAEAGYSWLYFALAGIMAFALCFIGSVFTAQQQLFSSTDNDLLLSMPIPPAYILGSRMLMLLILNLAFEVLVLAPVGAVWIARYGATLRGVVTFLVCALFLNLICLTFSSVLGWLLAVLTNRMRNKTLVSTAFSLLFLGGYFYLFYNMNSYLTTLVQNGAQIAEAVHRSIYPAWAFGAAVADGNLAALLGFLACCVLPFALVYIILSVSFLRVTTMNRGAAKIKYRERAMKVSGVNAALLGREVRHFFSNGMYVMNASLGGIFCIVGAVALIIELGKVNALIAAIPGLSGYLGAALALVLCALSSTQIVSAPSVSLEGRTLWVVRSMPVSSYQILMAKVNCHLLISIPPVLLAGVVAAAALRLQLLTAVCAILAPVALNYCCAYLGVVVNLHFPKFDFINEMAVVKQSASVVITMFATMGIVALPALLYIFKLRELISANSYLLLVTAVLVAASLVMDAYLKKGGSRRLEDF